MSTSWNLTPHLIVPDALAAIDFYTRAFGGSVAAKFEAPDGKYMHVDMDLNGAQIFFMDSSLMESIQTQAIPAPQVMLHLTVPDAGASVARAIAAGATEKQKVEETFWAQGYGQVIDPFGFVWEISTPKPFEQIEAPGRVQASAN
jgi:PhnB protein